MLMFCVYASIRYKNVKMLSSIKYFCLGCDTIPENNESLRASDSCDPGWSDAHFVNMGCLYFGTEEMNIDDANEFCGLNNSAHLVEALTSTPAARWIS